MCYYFQFLKKNSKTNFLNQSNKLRTLSSLSSSKHIKLFQHIFFNEKFNFFLFTIIQPQAASRPFASTNLLFSIYNKEKYIVPNGGCNIGTEKRATKPSGLCLFAYGGLYFIPKNIGMKTFIQPFFLLLKQTFVVVYKYKLVQPNIYRSLHVFRRPSC